MIPAKIFILPEPRARIMAMVFECPTECNGVAKLELIDGKQTITQVEVLKQTVSGTTAEHDKDDLMRFFSERSEAGDAHQWKVQWHSHVNMGTFFSGQDESAIQEIGNGGADWLVSLVFNKAGDYKARIDIFKPFAMKLEGVDLELIYEVDDYSEWAKAELAEKVTTETHNWPSKAADDDTKNSDYWDNWQRVHNPDSQDDEIPTKRYTDDGDWVDKEGKRWKYEKGEYVEVVGKELKRKLKAERKKNTEEKEHSEPTEQKRLLEMNDDEWDKVQSQYDEDKIGGFRVR